MIDAITRKGPAMNRLPEIVLKDAAAYIREHGWCQDQLAKLNGQVCLLGALDDIGEDAEGPAEELLRERLGGGSIADWNDTPGRTVEEVLSVLEGQ